MASDFKAIEEKWQKEWEQAGVFKASPDKRKKFFATFPYSYLNGPLHIGHAFTATRVDVAARYKRMKGFNVLFPYAFHATGEPVVGMAKRVKARDEKQIKILLDVGVPEKEIPKFEDPNYIIRFFRNSVEKSARRIGWGVDWRRSFTTVDPEYNRFIEWQYLTLREKGFVGKGTHPVIYCPNCQSPTGDHDRLEGEGASPVEFTLLKFKLEGKNEFLVAATLRPETVFGQTNLWVDPKQEYVRAKVNSETWVGSKQFFDKLREQLKKVEVIGKVSGKDLIGKKIVAPGIKREIPVLPASFCDLNIGTGIVTSVPSDAPYDYAALVDLQKAGDKTAKEIKIIPIIKTKEFGDTAAVAACKKYGVRDQNDPRLEQATADVYRAGFHTGVMNQNCDKYAGMPVEKAKELVKKELLVSGQASTMFETEARVVCRCTTPCIVKILQDQWFLKYSDKGWKALAWKALKQAKLYPEESRALFEHTIEWLNDKACARKSGLGTKLPWDPTWIVETLSDSTIYMAFYTIAHLVRGKANNLAPEVFEYVFLGGDKRKVTKKVFDPVFLAGAGDTRVTLLRDEKTLEEMRREFEYWYPVDFRNSADELVPNHLTFFLFQHAAIWPEKYWPAGIGVNGMLMVEGQKMSKSKGNFITLDTALAEFGADAVRTNLMASAEGLGQPNWTRENARAITAWLDRLLDYSKMKASTKRTDADAWLLSRMQAHIKAAAEEYEETKFRSALQAGFYGPMNDLKEYLNKTCGKPGPAFTTAVEAVVKMLAPIAPHAAEECWQNLGNKKFVVDAAFPEYDPALVDEKTEQAQTFSSGLQADIENVLKLTGLKPKKITLFVAPEWKRAVYRKASEIKNPAELLKTIMKDPEARKQGKEAVAYANYLAKHASELTGRVLSSKQETEAIDAQALKASFDAEVKIEPAEKSANPKAKQSVPMKPAIFIE